MVVTSKDGKRVEKVDIAKSGSDYLAKRADGPALFELDAKAVEDMQKAADGLKPAEVLLPRNKLNVATGFSLWGFRFPQLH